MQITDTILDDLENDPQELELLKKSLNQKQRKFVIWAIIAVVFALIAAGCWLAVHYTKMEGYEPGIIALAGLSLLCSLPAYRYYVGMNQDYLHIFFFANAQPSEKMPRFVPQIYSALGFILTVAIGWAWGAGFEQNIHYIAGFIGLFLVLQLFLLAIAQNLLKNYAQILSLRHNTPQAAIPLFWRASGLWLLFFGLLVMLGESGTVRPADVAPYVWDHTTALAMLVLAGLGYFGLNGLLGLVFYLRHRSPRAAQ